MRYNPLTMSGERLQPQPEMPDRRVMGQGSPDMPGPQTPHGGGINRPEFHPPRSEGEEPGILPSPGASQGEAVHQPSSITREPFYRSRRRVSLHEILNELVPLDIRVIEDYLETGEWRSDVLTHEERRKARRLRRRLLDSWDRGHFSLFD